MADGPEQRITVGIAYPALRKDGHGDWAAAAEVERMAHDFLASGREIGVLHADGTTGHGVVVESWIHRGPAETFTAPTGATVTINPGDWLLAVRWDPQVWTLIKAGKLDGWSIDGFARRRPNRLEPVPA